MTNEIRNNELLAWMRKTFKPVADGVLIDSSKLSASPFIKAEHAQDMLDYLIAGNIPGVRGLLHKMSSAGNEMAKDYLEQIKNVGSLEKKEPVKIEDATVQQDDNARLTELEAVIKTGMSSFIEVGMALKEIRDKQLHRPKYATFAGYCESVWDMTDRAARYLADGYEVVENFRNSCSEMRLPTMESQVRPMVKLEPVDQIKVWKKVVEDCPEGKEPTQDMVIDVIAQVIHEDVKKPNTSKAKAIEQVPQEDEKPAVNSPETPVQPEASGCNPVEPTAPEIPVLSVPKGEEPAKKPTVEVVEETPAEYMSLHIEVVKHLMRYFPEFCDKGLSEILKKYNPEQRLAILAMPRS